MKRRLLQLGVSLATLVFCLLAAEVFFRAVGFDFADEEKAQQRVAPYYRQPRDPTGTVFFKRHGPQAWSGQGLNTRLRQLSILPNPYRDEPVVTVEYDRNGFRNREGLDDWGIVVTGDSFTELAVLPQAELFTSILSRELGVPVLNLGTSYTGPLTQLSYLKDFGVSPGTRHSVVVFFEGNDIKDLAIEYGAWRHWKKTGERPLREFQKRTSLLQAAGERIVEGLRTIARRLRYALHLRHGARYLDAYFVSSRGEVPLSLDYTPPNRSELSTVTMDQLEYFFSEYAAFAREQQITAWLAYMPCKLRVLYGLLRVTDEASGEQRTWRPSDLPDVLAELCGRHGVEFVDLTPALSGFTREEEELPFNSIYDTHINTRGSRVVAMELSRHLRPRVLGEDPVVE